MPNPLFTTPAMAAVFSGEAWVGRMLAFEAALAHAEGRAGVIPMEAATAIGAACRVERFDTELLFREAAIAGTPAIPLVRLLTALVEGEGARFVHWGATSQDAVDTATVLQMRDGLELLLGGTIEIGTSCASLTRRYRRTLMVGRTLLQQALPITFGLKAARWLALVTRQLRALRELQASVLVVQFGGAAGTLAALGDQGIRITELLAAELGLAVPELPWHTERDRIAEVGAVLGVIAGAMAKIAGDLLLLAQSEVGEVCEGAASGKGGSSAMPQKQNPVDATMAVAAARLAIGVVPTLLLGMAQEHERAAGSWQAEWAALPDLFCYAAAAVERVRSALASLEVHPERMQENLEQSRGLVMAESLAMALAPQLGRPAAQQIVQEVCQRVMQDGTSLRRAAEGDKRIGSVLSSTALDRALDPAQYLGSSESFIERAIEEFEQIRQATA